MFVFHLAARYQENNKQPESMAAQNTKESIRKESVDCDEEEKNGSDERFFLLQIYGAYFQ